jgi:hypothetical protein
MKEKHRKMKYYLLLLISMSFGCCSFPEASTSLRPGDKVGIGLNEKYAECTGVVINYHSEWNRYHADNEMLFTISLSCENGIYLREQLFESQLLGKIE